MMLELMMLLVPAGFILLYDGWRKRRKKEYFVHSPLTSWLLAILQTQGEKPTVSIVG